MEKTLLLLVYAGIMEKSLAFTSTYGQRLCGVVEQGCGPGLLSSGPSSCPYSPNCLQEVGFSGIATWIYAGKRYPGEPSSDEGNAWGRLGEVLGRQGREDEARKAYEAGIGQAEKYGHDGMADDLRAALVGLGE